MLEVCTISSSTNTQVEIHLKPLAILCVADGSTRVISSNKKAKKNIIVMIDYFTKWIKD